MMNHHPLPKNSNDLRIGVALGGGSARGYAHIGALAVLEKYELKPNVIAGTSFGAVVGALYATGRSIEDLTDEASKMRRRDVFPHVADFGLHKAALFSGNRLESYFDRLLEGRHFSDLKTELAIVTTDVDTGERVILQDGPLAPALRASASLPGIFAPVEIKGRRMVDGGLGSPVPVETLEELMVDLAIGIGVGVESEDSQSIRVAQRFLASKFGSGLHRRLHDSVQRNPFAQLGRALAYTANSWRPQIKVGEYLHVQAKPPISWLHFHQAELAIKAGEDALERFMPSIRLALASR